MRSWTGGHRKETGKMIELIDQLMEILEARPDLPLYKRAVLKTVISQDHRKPPKDTTFHVHR